MDAPFLELRWVGKGTSPPVEARLLSEDRTRSRGARGKRKASANYLIFGDNLLALKALAADFTGKVKCCFIDPPYNTGSAFAQYDDGLEHSPWLSFMFDRLELIRPLLAEDGSVWITIDQHEGHYLKVLCDDIFGRKNFVADVVWQKRISPDARVPLGSAHDNLLVYMKNWEAGALNRVPLAEEKRAGYRNPDNDPRGPWASTDFTAQGWRPNQMYTIVTPSGRRLEPPPGRCWKNVEARFHELVADGMIWFGQGGSARPRVKSFLSKGERVSSWTWWPNNEVGHNQEAKKESIALFGAENAFATPKPERLLQRVLEIATNPGDLVLDVFAGSGTTGAVAHKMGRRWIMAESGEHMHTHIIPRMTRIIDGKDPGGVTAATGWAGGGGFRYYRLAPSLVEKDRWGRFVLNRKFSPEMIAEALCHEEGFAYEPNPDVYWQQGRASGQAFLYFSPSALGIEDLAALSEEVGDERSLLVFCPAFSGDANAFSNLTVKKVPQCLWDRAWLGEAAGDLFKDAAE